MEEHVKYLEVILEIDMELSTAVHLQKRHRLVNGSEESHWKSLGAQTESCTLVVQHGYKTPNQVWIYSVVAKSGSKAG